MKKAFKCVVSVIYPALLLVQASIAQPTVADTSLSALNYTVDYYHRAIGKQSKLYNGAAYTSYDRRIRGNAYYPDDTTGWKNGNINYGGVQYNSVPMKYDINKDEVVVLHYLKYDQFTLLSDRVHDFSFSGLHFIYLLADSTPNKAGKIKTGFYQELYKGKMQVLAKREKSLQSVADFAGKDEVYFYYRVLYFLKKDDSYYRLSTYEDLADILKDGRKELQQYIKTNKARFKKKPEAAFVEIVSYYDHLTK